MFHFRFGFNKAGRRTSRVRRAIPLACEMLEARAVPSVVPSFSVTQDWGSGFQALLKLTNQDSTPVANWTLAFDYAPSISAIWDASIVSHTGNHYVITNAGWNATLPGKGSVSFGFNAGPGNTTAVPVNYLLNGNPLSGQSSPPTLSINDVSATEGNSGTTPANFTVSLSTPAASTIKVNYATQDGSAQAGSDYQAASGTLTFNPGDKTKTIPISVIGDTNVEANETFSVNLSNPAGATLGKAQGTGTIVNDDTGPVQGNIQFQVTSDWGSGFTGNISIRNTARRPCWELVARVRFPADHKHLECLISSLLLGNHYVIQNADWNGSIAPGATVSFGFNGSPGHVTAGPTNYLLHTTQASGTGGSGTGGGSGGSGGGGTGGSNHAPVANNDSAWTTTGQPVSISVLANDTDADGDTLSVSSLSQGTNGTVVKNSNGTLTYAPRSGFTGTDSFTYSISDGRGGTSSASVSTTASSTSSNWRSKFTRPMST